MRKIIKSLMCRVIGHKDYATMGGIRCARCGRGNAPNFISKEVLAILHANLNFMRDGKR